MKKVDRAQLLTYPTLVETPFIIVKIGDYTFGTAQKITQGKNIKCDFPNYIKSLSVEKINGQVNQYTLTMSYVITVGDDPNMFDKIFSTVSQTRQITFSYGDWSFPDYAYQEEEAIITKLSERVDSNEISFTINAVSTSALLNATKANFPAQTAKVSDVVNNLIKNNKYNMKSIFKGMTNANLQKNNWIPGNDAPVRLEQRIGVSVLDYLKYAVSCMKSETDSSSDDSNKSSVYTLTYCDGKNENSQGSYFKISEIKANTNASAAEDLCTYEVNIGYPDNNLVIGFSWSQDENYSILYNYNGEIDVPSYSYSIDDNGYLVKNKVNNLTYNAVTSRVMPEDRDWWTKMTQFPTKASLTIKGLMRPQMLMSYVKLNVYYYGRKHISSGIYSIVKQTDNIGNNGYKTTLELLRIKGDTDAI